jgi:hypothetical protein
MLADGLNETLCDVLGDVVLGDEVNDGPNEDEVLLH